MDEILKSNPRDKKKSYLLKKLLLLLKNLEWLKNSKKLYVVFLRIIDDHEKQKIRVNTAKDLTLCAIDIFSEKNMKKQNFSLVVVIMSRFMSDI